MNFDESKVLLEAIWTLSQRSFMLLSRIKKLINDHEITTKAGLFREMFQEVDRDKNGSLSWKDLFSFFIDLHHDAHLAHLCSNMDMD